MTSSEEDHEHYEDDFDEEPFESTQQSVSGLQTSARQRPQQAASQSSRSSAMYSEEEPFESTHHEASSLLSQLPSITKPPQAGHSSPLESREDESASSYSDKFEEETGGHFVGTRSKQVASSPNSQSSRSSSRHDSEHAREIAGAHTGINTISGPTVAVSSSDIGSSKVPSDHGRREPGIGSVPLARVAPTLLGPGGAPPAMLPSETGHWRAKEAPEQEFDFSQLARHGLPMPAPPVAKATAEVSGQPLPPATILRSQDAVPRHLKADAWDIASLGQESRGYPRQAWPSAAVSSPSPVLPDAVRLVTGDARGFGGSSAGMVRTTEVQLVDNLAKKFVEARKTPELALQEREAYQRMLREVAWAALEPHAAQEVALLLSKKWLIPVSSAEALGAFRRCLHTILTDERVLDIVDHQMKMHFGPRTGLGL